VAFALAAIGLAAAAYMLYATVVVGNGWAVSAGLSLIGGLGVTAYAVAIDEAGL
jgi:hypothetical protein